MTTTVATAVPTQQRACASRSDGLWLAAAALLLYVVLAQDTLYAVDGHYLMLRALEGGLDHPFHLAYLPLLVAVKSLVLPLGGTIHQAGLVLSAGGMTIGVALCHHACRILGMSRLDAILTTALVAVAPAVVFFATVVEIHGVFFALVGVAYLASVRLAVRPGIGRAALLGAATALAYTSHASAILLPFALWPLVVVFSRERGQQRGLLWRLVLALVVHVALIQLIPLLAQWYGFEVGVGNAWHHFATFAKDYLPRPWMLLHTLGRDWLWPFLPVAAISLAALTSRRQRAIAVANAFGIMVFAMITLILMGAHTECGAYLLPMVWPAALVTVRWLPRRAAWLALLISLGAAIYQVAEHDAAPPGRAFAEGYEAVVDGRPAYLWIGSYAEIEGVLVHLPDVEFHLPIEDCNMPLESLPLALPALDQIFAAKIAAGKEIWLTQGAREYMLDPVWTPGAQAGVPLLEYMESHYDFEWFESAGFRAARLTPRR